MRAIALSLPTLGEHAFALRALDGHGELQVGTDDPAAANRLLAALLREPDGAQVDLAALPVTWRDRALAAIYCNEISEQIECRSKCSECDGEFELSFAMAAIIAQQDAKATELELALDDAGAWEIEPGTRIRAPKLADIASAAGPEQLCQTLVLEGYAKPERVEEALETAAPQLSFDLVAACPECEAEQQVSFDIAKFLIESLAGERAFLIRETHLIASRYGWDHATIMALPRRDRQAYASLIESERSASLARRA